MIGRRGHTPIERLSSADLVQMASESSGAPMQVGAVLLLRSATRTETAVRDALAERIRAVPRLRQRLVAAPLGCGRPVWVDDPGFDIARHVRRVQCPAPGDEHALLGVAAGVVTDRLPRDRPLWAATVVAGLCGGDTAIVLVLHHVVADGIGGLAVLARLVDGAPPPPLSLFPAPAPTGGRLFLDALRARLGAAAHVAELRAAADELVPSSTRRLPRCSLNRPTGPGRVLAVARAELAAVHAVGQAHDATVNDVVLTAVAGALSTVLEHRGEHADTIVVSVPISSRRDASANQLGNQAGVMPVAVPATGDRLQRLKATGGLARLRKTATPGSSAALLDPAFRILARMGALRWFINRQRLINTFVTNLRGPAHGMTLLGAEISAVIPVALITGNVAVAFAVLSYSGDLVVTIVADPENCPDLPLLKGALQSELDALTR